MPPEGLSSKETEVLYLIGHMKDLKKQMAEVLDEPVLSPAHLDSIQKVGELADQMSDVLGKLEALVPDIHGYGYHPGKDTPPLVVPYWVDLPEEKTDGTDGNFDPPTSTSADWDAVTQMFNSIGQGGSSHPWKYSDNPHLDTWIDMPGALFDCWSDLTEDLVKYVVKTLRKALG